MYDGMILFYNASYVQHSSGVALSDATSPSYAQGFLPHACPWIPFLSYPSLIDDSVCLQAFAPSVAHVPWGHQSSLYPVDPLTCHLMFVSPEDLTFKTTQHGLPFFSPSSPS